MSQFYREVHYKNAEDFLKALSLVSSDLDIEGFIFRGHSNDEEYKLIPTALRVENKEKLYSESAGLKPTNMSVTTTSGQSEAEKTSRTYDIPSTDLEFMQMHLEFKIIRDFYKLADSRGLAVPQSEGIRTSLAYERDMETPIQMLLDKEAYWIPHELLETTSLAQHYGLCTRLLDWSYDPYIACFFAANSSKVHDGSISVWCLNKEGLGTVNMTLPREERIQFVVPPYSTNPNLYAQSGIFTHLPTLRKQGQNIAYPSTCQYIDRAPLDEKIKKIIHEARSSKTVASPDVIQLMKLTLPARESANLLSLLFKIGYGHSRVFPGYSGVASEIIERGKNNLQKSK